MREHGETGGMTRREALGTLGALSVAAAAGGAVSLAATPAAAQALGQNESVEAGLARVFGGRPMKDGGSLIKLDVPLIAENGALVRSRARQRSTHNEERRVPSALGVHGHEAVIANDAP